VDDLERELRTLSARLDVPSAPDMRLAVRTRLAEPAPLSAGQPGRRRATVKVLASVATVLILLGVAFTLSPPMRAAAADFFRFAGVDVRWGEPASSVAPTAVLPSQTSVDRVAAAQRQVDFPIDVPSRLGVPDRVVIADGGRVVSLIYTRSDEVIRLDEFDGTLDPVFAKVVGTEAVHLDVSGADALWLKEPHSVTYVGRDGTPAEASARLSGATLIWQSGQVTYRLEGELNLAEAAAIAASLS
jgi:hypothetical protein